MYGGDCFRASTEWLFCNFFDRRQLASSFWNRTDTRNLNARRLKILTLVSKKNILVCDMLCCVVVTASSIWEAQLNF